MMENSKHQSKGSKPHHLVLLVHGLADTHHAWDRCIEELRRVPNPSDYLFHSSTVNGRFRTHDGFDRCGDRLAEEVRELLARHPNLSKLSVFGHSMGGMIARYALGVLFRPEDGTIAGLAPRHFVTLATPHLGLTVDDGPAQVPFVDWSGRLPLLGPSLKRGLQSAAHFVASRLFRGTGRHFLALDGGPGEAPLLVRLAMDEPDRGLYFFSALRSFASRACYGNVGRDHWVRWENATIRDTCQLPAIPSDTVRRGRGVVREDPPESGFRQMQLQTQPGQPPPPQQRQPQPGQQQQQQQQPGQRQQQEFRQLGPDALGTSSSSNSGRPPPAAAPPGGSRADVATTKQPVLVAAGAERPGRALEGPEAPGGGPGETAAAERKNVLPSHVLPAGPNAGVGSGPGEQLPARAGAEAEADLLLEAAHHPPRLPALHGAGVDSGGAAGAVGAAVDGGVRGLREVAAAAAAAVASVDDLALEAVVKRSRESPQLVVSFALARLQLLPWRRVDVSFAGAAMGTAHNNIQATRWTNLAGRGVLCHLRQHLQAAEELADEGRRPEEAACRG